jgi:glycosyltransferase involved in cell wall biosynthesis
MQTKNHSESLRILVPVLANLSFVQRDIATLASRYSVETVDCNSLARTPLNLRRVLRADCVFCWFASIRFLPLVLAARLLRRKIIVVAGGYDVACLPELKYGNMVGFWRPLLGRWLLRCAHLVLCVSKSNAAETQNNAHVPPHKLRLLYHGFEDVVGAAAAGARKEPCVLTVGTTDACTIHRKGLLQIARASRLLPHVPFVFAGRYEQAALDVLRQVSGSNATFLGKVSDSELRQLFARAKIYLQPSLHEAFGCSVAEAMLHDCIPIVSNRFALPEVVGKAGLQVDPEDAVALAAAIRRVLEGHWVPAESPRQRILSCFPADKREQFLIASVESVCGRAGFATPEDACLWAADAEARYDVASR